MELQKLHITILGESAHGSMPHLSKDALVAASAVILNLQLLVSRIKNPLASVVLTLNKVHGGSQFNIITDKVEIAGVIGAADTEALQNLRSSVENIINSSAALLGCTGTVAYGEYLTEGEAEGNGN